MWQDGIEFWQDGMVGPPLKMTQLRLWSHRSNYRSPFLLFTILFLLQGTGKEYPLRYVYTDEESCPIMEYKCKKAGGNGKAYWEKLNGDTMNGKNVAFSKHDIIDLHIAPYRMSNEEI